MNEVVEIANKYGITTDRLERAFNELYGMLFAYDPKDIQAVGALIESGLTPQRLNEATR